MNPLNSPTLAAHLWRESLTAVTRRHFLQHCTTGLGAMWLAQQGQRLAAAGASSPAALPHRPVAHFPAKAKHVIYLHMAGSPSQLELFEHKPELTKLDQQFCPPSFLEGKRFAFIRGTPRMLGSVHPFHQEPNTGNWISNQLPHFEQVMDQVSFIRSMRTEQFNHAPAQFLMQTGSPLIGGAPPGRQRTPARQACREGGHAWPGTRRPCRGGARPWPGESRSPVPRARWSR